MAILFKLDKKGRLIVTIALIIFSLLIVGAGKITSSIHTRSESLISDKAEWKDIVLEMEEYVPTCYKDDWKRCASNNPKTFIVVNTSKYSTIRSN